MHDHDHRRSHFMIKSSPPRVCEYVPNIHQKQHQLQDCQQEIHNQMHQQQYQQHYPQHLYQNQYPQQQLKTCSHDDHCMFAGASLQTSISSNAHSGDVYNADEFEDIDEDQISDFDEEEELRLSYERYRHNFIKQPDVTTQLLDFANMVSADIKKFFGRAKDHEDSCDIYEDKWVTSKSGRELYYADLLRIAQGDSEPVCKTKKKSMLSLSSSSSSSLSPHHDFDTRSQFSGRRDDSVGMGPLSELFEHGFSTYAQSTRDHRAMPPVSRAKGSTNSVSRTPHTFTARAIPMSERNFPESFWREPCSRVNGLSSNTCLNRLEISQHSMLSSSKLPDFSDLVESWQGGIDGVVTSDVDKRLLGNTPMEQR